YRVGSLRFACSLPCGKAVTGPKLVTVEHGSSLAVSCSYRPRYKLNSKYWCLKNSLLFCLTYIIQTDGSEVTVTRDRVSIRDNHTANSFTVTLSSVTLGDAGRYSCGVKRKLRRNARHSIKVMVSEPLQEPGLPPRPQHLRAPGTPSCPPGPLPAGPGPPLRAALSRDLLGPACSWPWGASAPPGSPWAGQGRFWGAESLCLLSCSCQLKRSLQ
uniref:Ig-like domain-containing protein n=1 Tax=Cyanoderma ruficeps TaxID=181631 RepID=A0A8C3P281_9PASS